MNQSQLECSDNEIRDDEDSDLDEDDFFGGDEIVPPSSHVDTREEFEEYTRETSSGKYPVSRWKAITPKENDVRFTIGEATEKVWIQCQQEVRDVKNMLRDRCKTSKPGIGGLFELLLGPESRVYRLFADQNGLAWTYPFWKTFMATFALQCALNLSTETLYSGCHGSLVGGFLSKEA